MSVNEATRNQIEAARPNAHTWLSANAGSGKTRVLTDRVARLLLDDVLPQNILCLTYTKAAASEMQNRLFQRLGDWAMKPDEALRGDLAELGVTEVADLRKARRLFARAIETPGGLKIQTIHSFCASILRRFPLEAGVSPDFTEMDERAGKLLREMVLEEMASDARHPLVEAVARHFTGADIDGLLDAILREGAAFLKPTPLEDIKSWLGLSHDTKVENVIADVFTPDALETIRLSIPVLLSQSSTMQKKAERLEAVDLSAPTIGSFLALKLALLNADGSIPKSPLTKPALAELGALGPRLIDLTERTFHAISTLNKLSTSDRTFALHAFAHAFVRDYSIRKQERGWLDFDDLINRAAALLNDADVTAWVLYRLDGGIDHILVDEAQDTSPAQWRVIESLAQEFLTGEGARSSQKRTIFVVGDPKQSIYSFQGADPAEFTRMREIFREGLSNVNDTLSERALEYSFRSSAAVLGLVDEALGASSGLGDSFRHKAFFDAMPGRVDLWPVFEKEEDPEPRAWFDPLDMPAPMDEKVQLAERIALEIETLITSGTLPNNEGAFRPVRAGDIMVLVQRRSEIFHQIIRACKQRNLPIAGADVLRIGGELAVKDITALLQFLATPEDDLALATVLRSPLFGWSEDKLFRLAHGRGKTYLWRALRNDAEAHAHELDVLNDLRREADFLRPYDLIDRLLTRHDGRRLLTARLGMEAVDGIDTLLQQALAYERIEIPSLTGFLTWLATDDIKVKRELGSGANQIRVMTVHGSKGLEAPIVMLPDTAVRRPRTGSDLLIIPDKGPVWRPKSAEMPDNLTPLTIAERARDEEERNRLLYVAMTRAEQWLIVAAAGDIGKTPEASWYGTIKAGMEAAGASPLMLNGEGFGLRLQHGTWEERDSLDSADETDSPHAPVPDWMWSKAPAPVVPLEPITPSGLAGAKALAGEGASLSEEDAKRRGRQIHLLLEHLPVYPKGDWPRLAQDVLKSGGDPADEADTAALLEEATRVLTDPSLAYLFDGESLAEVELSAPVPYGASHRLHGIVDRLLIKDDHILAIDFKSNALVPSAPEETPEGILAQMGAYEAALEALYPGRDIRTAILWTRNATLMELPAGLAFGTFRRLDASASHT